MKKPVRVTVTGAAGQISYSLLFRIASGEMLGLEQPVKLQLLEITPAMKALEGVVMELEDSAFSLLETIDLTDDAKTAFTDSQYGLLVGARPRGPGMERSDLLEANGGIFKIQGEAINDRADRDVKVVVVGNPANTNAWTCMRSAPDINSKQFTAMTRLDHNRAKAQLAKKIGVSVSKIKRMTIWGNHSTTQYPDLHHTLVGNDGIFNNVDSKWYTEEYIPRVAKRGAEIIDARGASSAASAANAALEHIRDWALGTPEGDWTSMAVPSDGSYGIKQGLIYSFPVICNSGEYSIVQGLDVNRFSRGRMEETEAELVEESEAISRLI